MADIALEVGVTKTTVSRALRGDPRISVETRARVEAAAARLGYRRDAALSVIAAMRWKGQGERGLTLAHLLDVNPAYEHFFTAEGHYRGAWEASRKLGYGRDAINAWTYPSPEALVRVLDARGVAGLVVHPFMREAWFDVLPWRRWHAVGVGLGRRSGRFPGPSVEVAADVSWLCDALARALVEAGERRVHVVNFAEVERLVGLHRAPLAYLAEAGRRLGGLDVGHALFPPENGDQPPEAFRAWLERERPRVVLGCNNTIYWWLRTLGVALPGAVRYASLVLNPMDSAAAVVSGMDTRLVDQGAAAVEVVDSLIRNHRTGADAAAREVLLRPRWFAGATLGLPVADPAAEG